MTSLAEHPVEQLGDPWSNLTRRDHDQVSLELGAVAGQIARLSRMRRAERPETHLPQDTSR